MDPKLSILTLHPQRWFWVWRAPIAGGDTRMKILSKTDPLIRLISGGTSVHEYSPGSFVKLSPSGIRARKSPHSPQVSSSTGPPLLSPLVEKHWLDRAWQPLA